MNNQTEKLKAFDNKKLIDIVKNYRQYGYDENLRQSAISILEERGITKEQLELTGDLINKSFDYANELFESYNKNAKKAFVYFIIIVASKIIAAFLDANSIFGLSLIFYLTNIVATILYIIFLIKAFINRQRLKREIGEKNTPEDIVMFYLLGMPFFIFMYYYYRNQIKQMINKIK